MGQSTRKRHALAEIRRRFRSALAYRNQKAEDFARKIEIGANHLSLVLNGHRDSMTVLNAVVSFILEVEREICEESARGTTEAHLTQLVA